LDKYDMMLREYQTKCGDEVLKSLDEMIFSENQVERKQLVENISLFREYEKKILERDIS